jgi:hypothetical protein
LTHVLFRAQLRTGVSKAQRAALLLHERRMLERLQKDEQASPRQAARSQHPTQQGMRWHGNVRRTPAMQRTANGMLPALEHAMRAVGARTVGGRTLGRERDGLAGHGAESLLLAAPARLKPDASAPGDGPHCPGRRRPKPLTSG